MINSENGQFLFDELGDKLKYSERSMEEAIRGNSQLRHPMRKHRKHEYFYEAYQLDGFEKALKKSLRLERLKYWLANFVGRG